MERNEIFMINKKKHLAVLSSAALSAMIIGALTTNVSAKTTDILTKDKNSGKLFKYNLQELMKAAEDNAIGLESPLFSRYAKEEVEAFFDDVKGYVTAKDVMTAAEDAAMNNQVFDLNSFTEKAKDDIIKPIKESDVTPVKPDINKETAIKLANEAIKVIPEKVTVENLVDAKAKLTVAETAVADAKAKGAVDADLVGLDKIENAKTQISKIEAELSGEDVAKKSVEALETAAKADLKVETNIKAAEDLVQPTKDAVAKVTIESVKTELTAKIDALEKTIKDARAEFEKAKAEVEAKAKAEKEATDLVVKAEGSKLQADYDTAKVAVDKLADGDVKTDLTKRLDAVKTEIDKVQIIKEVNSAKAEEFKAVIEKDAAKLGLDVTAYNALTTDGGYQQKVIDTVFKGKAIQPNAEYTAETLKAAFDNAVTAQTTKKLAADATKAIDDVKPATLPEGATEEQKAATIKEAVMKVQALLVEKAGDLGVDLTEYNKLGANGKYVVAKAAFDADTFTVKIFTDAVTAANKEVTDLIKDINTATGDGAVNTVKTKLTDNAKVLDIDLTNYNNLDTDYKTAVAKVVFDAIPKDKDNKVLGYADAASIKVVFDKAVADQIVVQLNAAMKAVNNAVDKTAMNNALKASCLEMSKIDGYSILTEDLKAAISNIIFEGRDIQPNGAYTYDSLKAAVKAQVDTQKVGIINAAVKAVNDVKVADVAKVTDTEVTSMKTALETNAIVLQLVIDDSKDGKVKSDYKALGEQYKAEVVKAVISARGEGFKDTTSIKTVFDNAVLVQKSKTSADFEAATLANINKAKDVDAVLLILNNAEETKALGLDTTIFANLSKENKALVAEKVYSDKLIQTNGIYATKDAVKISFDAEVSYRSKTDSAVKVAGAVKAVNDATAIDDTTKALKDNASTLEIAITDGIDASKLTDYDKLRKNFSDAVAKSVLEGKGKDGYLTKADIQKAFNDAVVAQKAAQTKEDATVDAINKVAKDDSAAIKAVVEANAEVLGLDVKAGSAYDALNNAGKLEATKAVITARELKDKNIFTVDTGVSDIKVAFNAGVISAQAKQQAAIDAVNAAGNASDMTKAITSNKDLLTLDLTAYDAMSDGNKEKVANAMISGKAVQPSGSYADAAAIKSVFNTAIANINGTVATVNAVKDAAEMKKVLSENVAALGLNLTDYNNLQDSYKDAVVAKVLSARPEKGYLSTVEVKNAFEAEAKAQLTVQAINLVNAAQSADVMQKVVFDAVNAGALGMTDAVNAVAKEKQVNVAQSMLDAKLLQANGKYVDAKSIVDTFINAAKTGTDDRTAPTVKEKMEITTDFIVTDNYDGTADQIAFNKGVIGEAGATIRLYAWNDANKDGKLDSSEIANAITLTAKSEAKDDKYIVATSQIGDLKAGDYTFVVTATDAFGNESVKDATHAIKFTLAKTSEKTDKLDAVKTALGKLPKVDEINKGTLDVAKASAKAVTDAIADATKAGATDDEVSKVDGYANLATVQAKISEVEKSIASDLAKETANTEIAKLNEYADDTSKVTASNKSAIQTLVDNANGAIKAYTDLGGKNDDLTRFANIAKVQDAINAIK